LNILLTGGAGYVGSACLRYMRQQGHEVVAYDNLTTGHRLAVDGAKLIVGDISDTALLTATLRDMRADAVMHFAAEISVEESVIAPKSHYRNNIYGTMSVLDAIRDANELGWKPAFRGIKPIIETAWKWHRNHPDGYT